MAVWVCGGAVTGKSSIASAALVGLGFRLIDVDEPFEELLAQYGLSPEGCGQGVHGYDGRVKQAVRRVGEGLVAELAEAGGGVVAPEAFVTGLKTAVAAGRLDSYYARRLADLVRERVGGEPVPARDFRRAVLPRMSDWEDPRDYLASQDEVTVGHLWAVAEELTRRTLRAGRSAREDLLLVETGGRSGNLLRRKGTLEGEGYRTFLVWVSVARAADAVRRNQTRGAMGGRLLDSGDVRSSFRAAQRAYRRLLPAFEPHVLEIDNSREGPEAIEDHARRVRRHVRAWLAAGGRRLYGRETVPTGGGGR